MNEKLMESFLHAHLIIKRNCCYHTLPTEV